MAIEVDTITGAAYWASYLINGDSSGMEDREIELCDAWAKSHEPWYVVSTVDTEEDGTPCEPYFSWSYGFHTGDDCSGGDLLDYVVHKQVAA